MNHQKHRFSLIHYLHKIYIIMFHPIFKKASITLTDAAHTPNYLLQNNHFPKLLTHLKCNSNINLKPIPFPGMFHIILKSTIRKSKGHSSSHILHTTFSHDCFVNYIYLYTLYKAVQNAV